MKKEELTKILEPIVREICKQMHEELSYAERKILALEICTSIIASTINLNQDLDSFSAELSNLLIDLLIEGGKQIVNYKCDFDAGKSKGEIL